MDKVNVNSKPAIKLIKHYIKDLSFENPQSINENNADNNNSNNISANVNLVHKSYKDSFFSVDVNYNCVCTSKGNGKKLFVLELDYFGFFKIMKNETHSESDLTKTATLLIFPFVKSIIEDISKKGGSIPISLQDINFDLIKT